MKKLVLTLFVIFALAPHTRAQETIEKETWAEKPALHNIDTKYSKESALILFDKRRIEYIDEPKDVLAEYYTVHRLIHINDDRGIENFNKIYLGLNENADIVDIKARAILPGGKIIELDRNNIKDLKEDGNTYKIFAMDGLSKGCEVEFFYTFKRPVNFFGREPLQTGFAIIHSSFQLIRPERLKFDVKVYNGDVKMTDTLVGKKSILNCVSDEVPGADEEKYAFYSANLKRIEYKLSYNDAKSKDERLFTWNEFAKRVFGSYSYCTDKDLKKIQEIVKANGWDKITDETKKITSVENYVKKAYAYNDDLKDDEPNMVGNVIKNKIGGTDGLVRLYGAIYKELGVNYQFVLTGDRSKAIVDKAFENWNNCDNILLYFPNQGKFLAPARSDYRYPYINAIWGDTEGVFLKGTSIGSFTTAIADIKKIDLQDYSQSFNNIESTLELDKDLDSVSIDAKQLFGGYEAAPYRGLFNFANDEQKRNAIKEIVKQVSSTEHILFSETLNTEFDSAKPFIIHSKTKSGELIEKAGNKLLLKIGMAIGPQVEMYQEKARLQPVDLEFGHVEERTINFVIPTGYAISNPNDLKMEQTYKDGDELTMGFVSGYQIKDNILSVHIKEEYRKTFYPLSQFDQFRKIINQSSDFNKVVLVLQKI